MSLFQKKRKYGRGNPGVSRGNWILWLIDRETGKMHVQLVEKQDKATLLPIIRDHVAEGSIVYHDDWAAYGQLHTDLDFRHYSVVHKYNFVQTHEDGSVVHTNTIEGLWGNLKAKLKYLHGTSRTKLPGYLDEYMFRQEKKDDLDFFLSFCDKIGRLNAPNAY